MVLMVATLVLSFSSFRMAVLIGAVAVMSVGLSLGALALFFGYPFGFMGIVGTMGLIGVAINDSIVVLAALREDPGAREGDPVAVRDVVVRSTRHVLSTTLTTNMGTHHNTSRRRAAVLSRRRNSSSNVATLHWISAQPGRCRLAFESLEDWRYFRSAIF